MAKTQLDKEKSGSMIGQQGDLNIIARFRPSIIGSHIINCQIQLWFMELLLVSLKEPQSCLDLHFGDDDHMGNERSTSMGMPCCFS